MSSQEAQSFWVHGLDFSFMIRNKTLFIIPHAEAEMLSQDSMNSFEAELFKKSVSKAPKRLPSDRENVDDHIETLFNGDQGVHISVEFQNVDCNVISWYLPNSPLIVRQKGIRVVPMSHVLNGPINVVVFYVEMPNGNHNNYAFVRVLGGLESYDLVRIAPTVTGQLERNEQFGVYKTEHNMIYTVYAPFGIPITHSHIKWSEYHGFPEYENLSYDHIKLKATVLNFNSDRELTEKDKEYVKNITVDFLSLMDRVTLDFNEACIDFRIEEKPN